MTTRSVETESPRSFQSIPWDRNFYPFRSGFTIFAPMGSLSNDEIYRPNMGYALPGLRKVSTAFMKDDWYKPYIGAAVKRKEGEDISVRAILTVNGKELLAGVLGVYPDQLNFTWRANEVRTALGSDDIISSLGDIGLRFEQVPQEASAAVL